MTSTPSTSSDLGPLVQQLRPKLRRILGGFHIPPADADDVLQEVFLAALRSWDAIDNREAWLMATLRKCCAGYWRRRRTNLLEGVDSELLEVLSTPQPAPQERAAMTWDLRSLCEILPARHRAVVWLRFGLGLSTEEVAERLGYCPASIRKLACRALARLRSAIETPALPAGPTARTRPAVRAASPRSGVAAKRIAASAGGYRRRA
jgi:RNA polymerase sigma factor (sigma-70 family)